MSSDQTKAVFLYEYEVYGGFYKLTGKRTFVDETDTHVCYRNRLGFKVWRPKNQYHRVEKINAQDNQKK
jgi:hypothetical protein